MNALELGLNVGELINLALQIATVVTVGVPVVFGLLMLIAGRGAKKVRTFSRR